MLGIDGVFFSEIFRSKIGKFELGLQPSITSLKYFSTFCYFWLFMHRHLMDSGGFSALLFLEMSPRKAEC